MVDTYDVVVVGGGVAGLSAALFTARAGLDTLVCNEGESILARNAHLENYPGFPAGVNPRTYLAMLDEQVGRAGAGRHQERVDGVEYAEKGFAVHTQKSTHAATRVVAASWDDIDYLEPLDPPTRTDGKEFLDAGEHGRTGIEGLYAAGRLADRYHQAIVAAGDGSETGITVVHDAIPDFYSDWVAPEGYFTNRDIDVPKGCEEIDEEERERREREALTVLLSYFAAPWAEGPTQHPEVRE